MTGPLPHRRSLALPMQMLLAMATFVVLVGAPPAHGRIMLVPLTGAPAAFLLPEAIAHGAALVGPGRLPGSFVVTGDAAALWPMALRRGATLFAASAAGCGQ